MKAHQHRRLARDQPILHGVDIDGHQRRDPHRPRLIRPDVGYNGDCVSLCLYAFGFDQEIGGYKAFNPLAA
jgi:hypothetical protein